MHIRTHRGVARCALRGEALAREAGCHAAYVAAALGDLLALLAHLACVPVVPGRKVARGAASPGRFHVSAGTCSECFIASGAPALVTPWADGSCVFNARHQALAGDTQRELRQAPTATNVPLECLHKAVCDTRAVAQRRGAALGPTRVEVGVAFVTWHGVELGARARRVCSAGPARQ